MQMVEWQKHKAEEEEKFEKDRAVQKKMKELAVKHVLDNQKRTSDAKALRDELRARRHMEQQEREWRRRERDAALKRQKDTEDLKTEILAQIQEKHDIMTEQAAVDKVVYDKIFGLQDTQLEEEKQKLEEKKMRNAQYSYDLKEQIHRFQMDKVKERKDHYIEGITLRKELSLRDQELKCFMERKLDELKYLPNSLKYIYMISSNLSYRHSIPI
jgi:hypothetical protein